MKIIYHIANKEDWQKAQKTATYVCDSLQSEGFIHCSDYEQVLATAQRFFANAHNLYLLAINTEALEAKLVYENTMGGEEQFPHLYGALNLSAIEAVKTFDKDEMGKYVFPKFDFLA